MDLFDAAKNAGGEPLAARMRPRTLDEYIGQDAIVGQGRLLRRAIQADRLSSVIFYGPPGSGKTTLARVIANHTKSAFITLNAVFSGIKDIRQSIEDAENNRKLYDKRTILFVDEVHRWNKSQQDALLPWVENGTIILVGATTENPFFEVNKALVSRSRIFELCTLTPDDLRKVAEQALCDVLRGYGKFHITFQEGALEHLIDTANGDARSLLNALELAVETTSPSPKSKNPDDSGDSKEHIYIDRECAEQSIQKKAVLYDKDGDYHYDIISAFIKSMRGRDPDAAVYWLARMVKAGEDPHFIFRRMLILACEDTGLADPNAICIVESAARAFDRVGMPEGRYFLAHAALYLSTAPKSNSAMAFFDALSSLEKESAQTQEGIPNHLRDASRDKEEFGHGENYLYPHAYRDHWVAQQYLPDALQGHVFYTPSLQGYEGTIRNEVLSRREAQIASLLSSESGESGGNDASQLFDLKQLIFEKAKLARNSRVYIHRADDSLLLWDAVRKIDSGLVCASVSTQKARELLTKYGETILTGVDANELERPVIALLGDIDNARSFEIPPPLCENVFDVLLFKDAFFSAAELAAFFPYLTELTERGIAAPQSRCVIAQKLPALGSRLSDFCGVLAKGESSAELNEKFKKCENDFYATHPETFFGFDISTLPFSGAAFSGAATDDTAANKNAHIAEFTTERHITKNDIQKWFSPDSRYGKFMAENFGAPQALIELLNTVCERQRSFSWKTKTLLICMHLH